MKNLVIISEDSKFITDKNSLSSLFKISHQITPPSIIKLVFSKNTIYMYDTFKKHQFSVKYIFTKLLGKRYSKFNNIESFFCQSPQTRTIFVAHDSSICNIYTYHYNWINIEDACIFVIGIMDTTHKKESSKFEAFTEQLFIKNKIKPCFDFSGKILVTNRVNPVFVKALLKKFPNASEIQIQLVDFMEGSTFDITNQYVADLYETKSLPKVSITSYSRSDASAFSIKYVPNAVNFAKLRNLIKSSTRIYDVFFAGNASGFRFNKIKNIITTLEKSSLSYKFILAHLSNQQKDEISKLAQSGKGEISFSNIPYEELLTLSSKSIAILDLYRLSSDEGFSFRIAEAIGLQCKIISDRLKLLDETFYTKNNILVSPDLSFSEEELRCFIQDAPCHYNEKDVQTFNLAPLL